MDNLVGNVSSNTSDTAQSEMPHAVKTDTNPVQKKPKITMVRLILIAVVIIINGGALFFLAILIQFIISQTTNPNPAGIAIIGLLPLVIYAVTTACILDVLFLSVYLLTHRDETGKRKILASLGLMFMLLLLVCAILYLVNL